MLTKFVFFLKNGCDLLEDGYEVTEKDDDYSYSQVIILKTDKAIIHFYPDGSPGYYGYNAKEYMDYGDREFEWYRNGQLKSEKVYGETIPFKEKEIAPGVKKLSNEFDPLKYELYWYDNGELKEAMFYLTDWIYIIYKWYENGQLCDQGLYNGCFEDEYGNRKPVKHGSYTSWHKNGQLSGKGNFENGEKVGMWNNWNEDGSVKE